MSPRGFFVRYRSYRALDADHAAYLTHGGMVVGVDPGQAPAPNTPVQLRVEGPGDLSFVLSGRAGAHATGRGLMVALDEGTDARSALDAAVESEAFRAQVTAEDPGAMSPPEVGTYEVDEGPAEIPTDPGFVPLADMFEDATPVDALPPFAVPPGTPQDNAPPLSMEPSPLASEAGTELHPDVRAARRRPAPSAQRPPTVIRAARGGETYQVLVVKIFRVLDFVEQLDRFISAAELDLDHADKDLTRGQIVRLRLTLPGHNVFEMWSVVERAEGGKVTLRVRDNDEPYLRARLYPESVAAKARRQREAQSDDPGTPIQVVQFSETMASEDETKMPLRRRLARMGMDDKINLALSGNREERMALAMDSNKAVHHYLLKNAKLTLDEIAHMARLPSLNPDVLDKIAENPAYTQNPSVTKALVFNPRTPVRTAIRLLDRLPRNELVNLSKRTTMNQRLVMAAKNKLFKVK